MEYNNNIFSLNINNLIYCKKFAHKDTLMIFNDTNAHHISQLINKYCGNNLMKEIDYSANLKKCFSIEYLNILYKVGV